MRDKTVGDAMTPLESVYMLDLNGVISRKMMNEVCCDSNVKLTCPFD